MARLSQATQVAEATPWKPAVHSTLPRPLTVCEAGVVTSMLLLPASCALAWHVFSVQPLKVNAALGTRQLPTPVPDQDVPQSTLPRAVTVVWAPFATSGAQVSVQPSEHAAVPSVLASKSQRGAVVQPTGHSAVPSVVAVRSHVDTPSDASPLHVGVGVPVHVKPHTLPPSAFVQSVGVVGGSDRSTAAQPSRARSTPAAAGAPEPATHVFSVHAVPDPVYPALHAHENVPAMFVHAAFVSQLSVSSVHSSTSLHAMSPAEKVPAVQLGWVRPVAISHPELHVSTQLAPSASVAPSAQAASSAPFSGAASPLTMQSCARAEPSSPSSTRAESACPWRAIAPPQSPAPHAPPPSS